MFEDFSSSSETKIEDLQKEVLRLQKALAISQDNERSLKERLSAAQHSATNYKVRFERAERERDAAQAKLHRLGYV